MHLFDIPWYALIALAGTAVTGTIAVVRALRGTNAPAADTTPEV